MSNTNDQVIERYLNEMLDRIGDGNLELREVRDQVESLKTEYEKEREAAKHAPPDKKKEFERYATALAGGLPGMTKGTLDSIAAFQQKPPDVIVGSAAVMDICASLASTLGGLSAAGGPPGALFSAMFSMVSMILGFFAPKPPSLISQIEEMLRDLHAETQKSEIKAAQEAVFVYVDGCAAFMKPAPDGGVRNPALLTTEMKRFNLVEGNSLKSIRTVRGWLLEEANQELEGWPEILNLLCQVYMHLMLAVTRQNLYANDKAKIEKYVGDPPDAVKKAAWADLQVEAEVKLENMKLNNAQQLGFLKQTLPVARKRGTFVISLTKGEVFAATGAKALRNGAWGPVIFNGCRRVSVVPPREGVDHPNATYDFWVLGRMNNIVQNNYAYHNQLAIRTRTLTKRDSVMVGVAGTAYQWLDWWPLPDVRTQFRLFATRNLEHGGELASYYWNLSDPTKIINSRRFPWVSPKMSYVRIVRPSVTALPGDPDGPTAPPYLLNGRDIFYGTLENSKEIWVSQEETGTDLVPISMGSYNGIAVDPYCVWAYGNDGLVCATHASVAAYILKKRPSPNWLGPPKSNKPNISTLSLSGDGTLTACDGNILWSGIYRIDFAQQKHEDKLTVEWEQYAELKGAAQVQKLPILGWPLIDASIQTLTEPATDLARPSFLLN